MMGSIVRIPALSVSSDRLDARYNAPEAVNTRVLIERCGIEVRELGRLFKDLVCGPFGSTLTADQHSEDGEILLAQPTNISSFLFDDAKSWRISRRTLITSGLPLYQAGTLLFARVGIYPHVGMLTASVGDATISSSMIAGTASGDVDHAYLLALLRSRIGQSLLFAAQKVTAQPTIGTYEIGATRVPVPNPLAQRYIGDKVRQAGRLRERARRLEVTVATTHAQYIVPPTGIDFARRTRRLSARSLTERLDAHFYPSAVEQYFRQLGGPTRLLGRVCSLVVNGQSQPEAEVGVPQATVTNLGRSFIEGSLRTVQRPADVSRALLAHDLLLCNAAHNKSYIGRDVTYSQVEGLYPSTEVMVLRVDRTQLPASFVRQYLKTDIGFLQIQSTIRGITAHTYPTDVKSLDIPIPAVPDADREAWFATDDHMLAAGRCCDVAKALTTAATMLVERLIDGRITEADLIAAQKALDAGDRNADREILKALRQSDAPGAQLLIADVDVDVDGLYALLDDSEGLDP